jgi:hypothetical protein
MVAVRELVTLGKVSPGCGVIEPIAIFTCPYSIQILALRGVGS